jgi:hypothetical protein
MPRGKIAMVNHSALNKGGVNGTTVRYLLLFFILLLVGCQGSNMPVVIPAGKARPPLGQTQPAVQPVAAPNKPFVLEGVKYYMISEVDIARYVSSYNKLQSQNAQLKGIKSPTVNVEARNNGGVTELSMVNESELNTPSLIDFDDLGVMPVLLAAPVIEEENPSDWKLGDYLFTVVFLAGIAFAVCGYFKRKKEASSLTKEKMAREAKEVLTSG